MFEPLNPAQLQAVRHRDGPLLILAGAGSGKTRVITFRLAQLLSRGVPPQDILVVTFTNKAAQELRHRVEEILSPTEAADESAQRLPRWIGTFHSIGARLLRALAHQAGLPTHFQILDEDDQLKVCKELLAEENIDERVLPSRALRAHIDRAKNQGLVAARFVGTDVFSDLVARLYKRYEQKLRSLGAADFGDLLLLPVVLAEENPDVAAKLSSRFQHVLVDEFQDVNVVQYRLLKLFAGQTRNLTVVGDDDQAIYGWRGANVSFLLDFARDWPEAAVVKLEENYRSSQVILDAAHAVVACNTDRHAKKLFTRRDGGEPIVFFRARDDRAEARFVAETIFRLQTEEGLDPEDFAVIYRTNAQSLRFEESLLALGIPFSLLGGMRFFERAEVKDVLAYLRLCLNPDDELALRRVINVPARSIGKTTVDKLLTLAHAQDVTLWTVVRQAATDGVAVSKKKRADLQAFVHLIEKLGQRATECSVSALLQEVLDTSGYKLMLCTGLPEDETRLQNLQALLGSVVEEERAAHQAVKQYEQQAKPADGEAFLDDAPQPMRLADYLMRVSLQTDDGQQTGRGVKLLTAHVAKGLEFPVVFVTGLEEGLFPSLRAGNPSLRESEDERIVEERRLAYVAITRAKNQLFLTCADRRWLWGNELRQTEVSRFVRSIPQKMLVWASDPGPNRSVSSTTPTPACAPGLTPHHNDEIDDFHFHPGEVDWPESTEASDPTGRNPCVGPVSDPDRKVRSVTLSHDVRIDYDTEEGPPVGLRVRHNTLGLGRLVGRLPRPHHNPTVTVRFDTGQTRQIDLRFLEQLPTSTDNDFNVEGD